MKQISVCYSPDLFHLFSDRESLVVVVDILRATTTMCLALDNSVEQIIPVKTVAEALEYRDEPDTIIAAERNGKIVKGFDYGNSPVPFLDNTFLCKTLVMTTTNGTRAMHQAAQDHEVIAGAFVNLSAVSEYCIHSGKNVIIACSGWKGKYCVEDSIFAGALAQSILSKGKYMHDCDSTLTAMYLYDKGKENLEEFIQNASHRRRLDSMDIRKDVEVSFQHNIVESVPVFDNGVLRKS